SPRLVRRESADYRGPYGGNAQSCRSIEHQSAAPRSRTTHIEGVMTEGNPRRPIALIGCSDEWLCRSIESVFAGRGYDVTRTGSGKQALKLARRGGYDVLLFDEQLELLHGTDVCLALRVVPLFDHAPPIVIIPSS